MSHSPIDPAILYWGTPVVLVSTLNTDGTANLAPMSSAFWLGDRCMLGFGRNQHTTQNLLRTGQCVLNLASDKQGQAVNGLARITGSNPVPEHKAQMGYSFVKDKFGAAGLTPLPATYVAAHRVAECPVNMEAELVGTYPAAGGLVTVFEVKVLKTWVIDELRMKGYANRIDPDAWRPMIMSFQKLYGLRIGVLEESKLAQIDEEHYRVLKKLASAEGRLVEGSGPMP